MNFIIDEKVVIALISIVGGWALSQGTTVFRDWWAARKRCHGLIIELKDTQEQLKRLQLIVQRQMQFFALRGIEPRTPLPIHNMFFKQFFKDAFPHLNRTQRLSYQIIHSSIDALNEQLASQSRFHNESYKLKAFGKDSDELMPLVQEAGDRSIALYKGVMETMWHIQHHLNNPVSPVLDSFGPVHRSYLVFLKELDDDVKKFLEAAKGLKREDLEKFYDE